MTAPGEGAPHPAAAIPRTDVLTRDVQPYAPTLRGAYLESEVVAMRLTWRDGVATALGLLGAMVVLAVLQGWDWPLLGTYRAGVVALAAIGVPMCLIGAYPFWDSVAFANPRLILRDPFLTISAVLGFAAATSLVIGLVTGTELPFVSLAVLMGVLWFAATVRHAVEEAPRGATPAMAPDSS
jgi:hypothetical protein